MRSGGRSITTYPVQNVDEPYYIGTIDKFCPLPILLPVKDVADLIVELGRGAVEAKKLFQGLGLRTDARLGSPRGGGRTERLLSKIHRAYH